MKRFFLFAILVLTQIQSFAYPYHIASRLHTGDIFPDHRIRNVLVDTEDFLWIGTENGLGRYDGERYETVPGGPAVGALCQIADEIYVGADNGLFIYSPGNNTLLPVVAETKYHVKISRRVTGLASYGNFLLIGTHGQGLFIYDTQKDILLQRSVDMPYIVDIAISGDGYIYVCEKDRGIFSFRSDFECMEQISDKAGIKRILCTDASLWYMTDTSIAQINKNGRAAVKQLPGLPEDFIDYSEKYILAGCNDGFVLIDKADLSTKPFGIWIPLNDNLVKGCQQLYMDANGTIWIVSSDYGVLYLTSNNIEAFFHPLDKGQNIVFSETSDKTVWIGTDNGVMWLDALHGTIERGPMQGKVISALLADGSDLWIEVKGEGVFKYNVQTHKLSHYSIIGYDSYITLNSNGRIEAMSLWDSFIYNPSTDSFVVKHDGGASIRSPRNALYAEGMIEPQGITSVYFSKDGGIYTAVGNCVYESRPLSKEVRYYPFGNKVGTLFCDKNGNVWAGGVGIGLWELKDGKMEHVDIQNGENSAQNIQTIIQDNQGYIWICSDLGISKIDPATGNISYASLASRVMENCRFLPLSAMCSSNGTLYFGFEKGFVSFPSPDNEHISSSRVIISSISFRNGEPTIPNLYRRDQLKLGYRCNSFTLSFAMPGCNDPKWNKYSYTLSGIDDKTPMWTSESSASYSKLSPGKYEFKVIGRNYEESIPTEPAKITIIISPPWWQSTAAIILYALAIVGTIVFLTYKIKKRINDKYHDKMQKHQEEIEKEAYRQKMSFFMGMVHEIRTPLTVMRLSMDKLLKGINGAGTGKSLSILKENIDYMQSTIDGILNYQKNNVGGVHVTLSETDITNICQNAFDMMSELATLQKITLCKDIPLESIMAMADEPFFTKILTNLLSNALKYAEHKVALSVHYDNGDAIIKISDDGPGVKDSEKDKIFGMFYKTAGDAVAEASGMGVGLAYSRQLAIAHNGSLTVEDASPHGASFILKLPATLNSTPETPKEIPASSLCANPGKADLVVADDNVRLLEMLREELSEWYNVRTAQNGADALDLVKSENTDIIISDVMMPVMDGNRLCQTIKEDINFNHIPFIMLTAKTSVDAKVEGLENGADAYIEKPFSIIQLHLQIENLLKLRAAYYDALKNEAGRKQGIMPQAVVQKDSKFMETINSAIEEHLSQESFSVDTLAGRVYMSKSTFFRKFKTVAGCSPNDYLKNYRLNRAAQMISEGLRIAEAAEKVGFYSPSYFAKCFKAKFGMLPREWCLKK